MVGNLARVLVYAEYLVLYRKKETLDAACPHLATDSQHETRSPKIEDHKYESDEVESSKQLIAQDTIVILGTLLKYANKFP